VLEKLGCPQNVIAFRALGKIDRSDYENVLEPAVEQMINDQGEVRLVYVLDEMFDGYTISAGWEDTKLGLGHVTKWKRCAVVTSHDWVKHWIGMFRWLIPCSIKIFDADETERAIAWAAADS
jgi:hypothetical protein